MRGDIHKDKCRDTQDDIPCRGSSGRCPVAAPGGAGGASFLHVLRSPGSSSSAVPLAPLYSPRSAVRVRRHWGDSEVNRQVVRLLGGHAGFLSRITHDQLLSTMSGPHFQRILRRWRSVHHGAIVHIWYRRSFASFNVCCLGT